MRVVSKVALRGLRQRERVQKLAEAAPACVRVVPAKEEYRAVLKHPTGGGFPAEGSKEWPDDRFTKRRLADGSVTREAAKRVAQHRDNGEQRQRDQRSQSPHRVEHHEKDKPNSAA